MINSKNKRSLKIPLLIVTILLLVGIGVSIEPTKLPLSTVQNNGDTTTQTAKNISYNCEDNKKIKAEYNSDRVDLELSDGRNLTLQKAVSAAGTRYAANDESIVFWSQGKEAFIQEGEQTVYAGCNGISFDGGTMQVTKSEPITIKGELVCLPHKNEGGVRTMECAYGLKGDNGNYYGLSDSDPSYKNIMDVQTGQKIEVTGDLDIKDTKYKSIGTITIQSLTQK